jgi:hypothetical protein
VTALARCSSTCTDKLQIRPLVREGARQEQNRKYLKIFSMEMKEKLIAIPSWWPDTTTDWSTGRRALTLTLRLSVGRNITLLFNEPRLTKAFYIYNVYSKALLYHTYKRVYIPDS